MMGISPKETPEMGFRQCSLFLLEDGSCFEVSNCEINIDPSCSREDINSSKN